MSPSRSQRYRKAIENVARYMSRAALSVERVRYNRAEDTVTVSKKPFGSSQEESRSYRGKQRRQEREEQETEFVLIDTGKGTAAGKPISTWARLIRRIFEVDPLRCRRCAAEMRLIAFITDFRQTSRILEHIGEQTIRLRTGPDLSGLNPPRNTPLPGNVRPKTHDSAPTGSGSRQNPSARLEVEPSVGRLSAHEPQGMP